MLVKRNPENRSFHQSGANTAKFEDAPTTWGLNLELQAKNHEVRWTRPRSFCRGSEKEVCGSETLVHRVELVTYQCLGEKTTRMQRCRPQLIGRFKAANSCVIN